MARSWVNALVLSIACLAGCANQRGEEYFPAFSKGAYWEYTFQYMGPLLGVQSGTMSIRIDGEETINGRTYLKRVVVYSGVPGAEPRIGYYRRTPEGLFKIDGGQNDTTEYLETPFPIAVGKKWTAAGALRTLHYSADSIETLELFDRKYNDCLKISYSGKERGRTLEGTVWLAKGIGSVKEISKRPGLTFEAILEKHKL